jgi:hypothetical protein
MKLITIFREEPVHPGGPSTMDIQEQDLDEFLALGWRVQSTPDGWETEMSPDETGDDMGMKPKPKPRKPKY